MEERRIVTILFCDVSGSTALAERVDAEDWAEIISGAYPLLIEPVQRYGGTVARLMGDAILAFFGAPVSHEDDPRRAILAALDIQSGIAAHREQVLADYGLDFNVRAPANRSTSDCCYAACAVPQRSSGNVIAVTAWA